jgi:predicted enzyme related to lactoylglutathione lyase
MTSPKSPVPRLFRVALPVTDIEKASAFYARVLATPGERVSKNRHYFDCGGTILACVEPGPQQSTRDTPNQEYLYFVVSDIEAVFKRAKEAGCRSLDEKVETQHWGERAFFAEDPFGNPLGFIDEATLFTGSRPRA